MKIKKGDQVEIISGKDKGKRGKVEKVLPFEGRVVVEGLNMRKKHVRSSREGESGQRLEMAFPVDISNVMLVCPHTDKPTRVGFMVKGDQKVRISKKANKEI